MKPQDAKLEALLEAEPNQFLKDEIENDWFNGKLDNDGKKVDHFERPKLSAERTGEDIPEEKPAKKKKK